MKSTLFIGSVVLDMVVQLDHLPKLKEDINTEGVKLSVGGCSRNACQIVKHFGLPTISCSPIGTGPFASLLRSLLDEEPIIKLENQDNGSCIYDVYGCTDYKAKNYDYKADNRVPSKLTFNSNGGSFSQDTNENILKIVEEIMTLENFNLKI